MDAMASHDNNCVGDLEFTMIGGTAAPAKEAVA